MALKRVTVVCALALSACDVEPIASGSGGVDADHGLVALLGDYTSVQVALLGPDGQVLSASFLSSGSAPTSGLAFAFSGDTVLPSSPSPSGEVVLIDRFGTNVLSWANPRTAEVRTQLVVGPSRQEVEEIGIRVTILNTSGGAATYEAVSLVGLALEVGIRRGLYRGGKPGDTV